MRFVRAYDEFTALVRSMSPSPVRVRVILAFYNHVAEGAGFYEIPKKLLLTIEGRGTTLCHSRALLERHKASGETIAPNANRIMKDLIGHASELELAELAEVFRDAFDSRPERGRSCRLHYLARWAADLATQRRMAPAYCLGMISRLCGRSGS